MQTKCNQCPRKCNADFKARDKFGFCGAPVLPKIARAGLHFGEEPCISGENGSGTIFFSGCNLKCVYCQNYDISNQNFGYAVSINRLAEIFKELEQGGAHNINFVTPSHYIHAIKEALNIYKPNIPLVYNSSSYDDINVVKENIFDIYLLDFKYFDNLKAQKYSFVNNYFEIATKFIKAAYMQKEIPVFKNGIMQSGVIIRNMILPLCTNDSIKVIDWVKENAENAYFSLLAQYTPCFKAEEFKEINRTITKREYNKVVEYLLNKNLKNAYVQDYNSFGREFTPKFDGFGVIR